MAGNAIFSNSIGMHEQMGALSAGKTSQTPPVEQDISVTLVQCLMLKLLINTKTITWLYTTEIIKKKDMRVYSRGHDELSLTLLHIKAMGPSRQGTWALDITARCSVKHQSAGAY